MIKLLGQVLELCVVLVDERSGVVFSTRLPRFMPSPTSANGS